MKTFARRRWWLIMLPLLVLSIGLWRVQEARSYVPRTSPLYVGPMGSTNVTQMPIVWRDNGIWILRPDTINSFVQTPQKRATNWNSAPIALHFPSNDQNVKTTVGPKGREVLRTKGHSLELWRDGRRVSGALEPKQRNRNGNMNPSPPSPLAISPDGSRWATGSQMNALFESGENAVSAQGVALWDARGNKTIARMNAKLGNITALAFSPDSQQLAAVAADGWAFVWDADDGKLVRQWRAHPWVAATLAWSPDGQTLATGGNPRLGEAGMWTLGISNGSSVSADTGFLSGSMKRESRVMELKGDAQNNLTINGQTDRSLRLWNVQSGQMLRKWESKTGVCSAQFSPDGRELAIGTHGKALLMDAANLKVVRRLPMPNYPKWPASVAWAPNGKTLAVACAPQLTLQRVH